LRREISRRCAAILTQVAIVLSVLGSRCRDGPRESQRGSPIACVLAERRRERERRAARSLSWASACRLPHHPGQRLPENTQYNRNLRENCGATSPRSRGATADRLRQGKRLSFRPGAPRARDGDASEDVHRLASVLLRCLLRRRRARRGKRDAITAGGMAAADSHSHVDPANDRFQRTRCSVAEDGLVSITSSSPALWRGARDPQSEHRRRTDVVEGEALWASERRPGSRSGGTKRARLHDGRRRQPLARLVGPRDRAAGTLLPGRMQTFVELWAHSPATSRPPLKASGREERRRSRATTGRVFVVLGPARLPDRVDTRRRSARDGRVADAFVMYGLPQ